MIWIYLTVALVALLIYGHSPAEIRMEAEEATVKDLDYSPDTRRTSIAPTFGRNGGVTVVNTGRPEAFTVVLTCSDGSVLAHECRDSYAKLAIGDRVRVQWKFTRLRWFGTESKIVGIGKVS